MKQALLAAALLVVPTVAFAQSPPQQSSQEALTSALAGSLSHALGEVDGLKAQVADLQKQLTDLKAPKPAAPASAASH